MLRGDRQSAMTNLSIGIRTDIVSLRVRELKTTPHPLLGIVGGRHVPR